MDSNAHDPTQIARPRGGGREPTAERTVRRQPIGQNPKVAKETPTLLSYLSARGLLINRAGLSWCCEEGLVGTRPIAAWTSIAGTAGPAPARRTLDPTSGGWAARNSAKRPRIDDEAGDMESEEDALLVATLR